MPKREVDKRKTSKALRKLRRAAERATGEDGPGLTPWEKDFVAGVTTRLEKYGSAFRDPGKGRLEEALSARQAQVTRVIEKKSRKARTVAEKPAAPENELRANRKPAPQAGLQRKSGLRAKPKPAKAKAGWKPRGRDINDDAPAPAADPPARERPSLKVIRGGKSG